MLANGDINLKSIKYNFIEVLGCVTEERPKLEVSQFFLTTHLPLRYHHSPSCLQILLGGLLLRS